MTFDRKGSSQKPKSQFQRSAIALENNRKLPHPTREVHHYDLRYAMLPCPIEGEHVQVKLRGDMIIACSLQRKCVFACSLEDRARKINWVLCLKGKRFHSQDVIEK